MAAGGKLNMKQNKVKVRYLTELALLVAIELVMKLTGLSSIPVGPLNMTFTTVPIAVGAMLMGPLAGGILGAVYGFTSFYDAVSGASVMTGVFFQLSPIHTFILCVGTRTLVGVGAGWLFRLFRRVDKTDTVAYFLGGLCTPLLNTILFMGYIVLVFYGSEYIQSRVSTLGATGPLMFVLLSVGVQGLVEAAVGTIVGGGVTKGVAKALQKD
jgi:uncharacterized membrane protein